MAPKKTKRLFAAVKIMPSADFSCSYLTLRQDLAHERITWVREGNMHLTLKFFGETAVTGISDIDHCLSAAASASNCFSYRITGAGIFGSRYDPRVIWFGLSAGNELPLLYERVNIELARINIFPDRQNFVPHLTVGRIKREIADKQLFQQIINQYRECSFGNQLVTELVMYESLLRPEGPQYIPLNRYALTRVTGD